MVRTLISMYVTYSQNYQSTPHNHRDKIKKQTFLKTFNYKYVTPLKIYNVVGYNYVSDCNKVTLSNFESSRIIICSQFDKVTLLQLNK